MIKKIFFLSVFGLLGVFFLFKRDTWIGFYYPDRDNLFLYTQSPEFDSLEECRQWVDTQIYIYNPSDNNYDYECGRNCKLQENGLYLCKETTN
jgi:hypothetical protein